MLILNYIMFWNIIRHIYKSNEMFVINVNFVHYVKSGETGGIIVIASSLSLLSLGVTGCCIAGVFCTITRPNELICTVQEQILANGVDRYHQNHVNNSLFYEHPYSVYLSYYHHQIGSMNYYPLFTVRSWNNGVRCMYFCILIHNTQHFNFP